MRATGAKTLDRDSRATGAGSRSTAAAGLLTLKAELAFLAEVFYFFPLRWGKLSDPHASPLVLSPSDGNSLHHTLRFQRRTNRCAEMCAEKPLESKPSSPSTIRAALKTEVARTLRRAPEKRGRARTHAGLDKSLLRAVRSLQIQFSKVLLCTGQKTFETGWRYLWI